MASQCPLCGAKAFDKSRYSGYYCFPRLGGCGMSSPINIDNYKGLLSFRIENNEFMDKQINAYAHGLYIPYKSSYASDLTRLILDIKGSTVCDIDAVKEKASAIIKNDLDLIITSIDKYKKSRPIIISMTRSKPDNFWEEHALQFRVSISMALKNSSVKIKKSNEIWAIDGVNYIKRIKETQTTHLAHSKISKNNGPAPYRGITKDTCILNGDINNKYIILIDDIYTPNVCVDEDCIQYLYDNGARDVLLYVLGITIKPPKEDNDLDVLF